MRNVTRDYLGTQHWFQNGKGVWQGCILSPCLFNFYVEYIMGFPSGTNAKEPSYQCKGRKRRRFDSWVSKIPWRRAWQPPQVFLPGESTLTEEPGWLQSIESHRVGHDWVTELNWSTYMKLLIFLPEILIPTCDSSSLSFCMICVCAC